MINVKDFGAVGDGVTDDKDAILSMGMSDSYTYALEAGANLVRVGSRIFGERKY